MLVYISSMIMDKQKKLLVAVIILLIAFICLLGITSFNESTKDPSPDKRPYETEIVNEQSHYAGVDFFSDRQDRQTYLVDSESGEVQVTWDADEARDGDTVRRFNYGLVWSGGDLIYTDYRGRIARITQSNKSTKSEMKWQNNIGHHDVGVYDGNILAFSRENIYSEKLDLLVQDDVIYQINPKNGYKFGDSISMYEVLSSSNRVDIQKRFNENLLQGRSIDGGIREGGQYEAKNNSIKLFHANAITVLDDNYGEPFTKGRVLLSLRNIDLVVLLDVESEEVVWTSKGVDLDRQHHPTMTSDGNIMLYDNGWERRNATRVIQINQQKEIVWSYQAEPPESFYSQYMGSAQELPNGNVLVANSGNNSAFEVNKNKEIVWRMGTINHGGIFRYTRFSKDCIQSVISGEKQHSKLCQ